MIIARKIGGMLAGSLFAIALIATISIFSLSNFTQYDTVKGVISQIVREQQSLGPLNGQTNQVVDALKAQCQGRDSFEVPYGGASVKIDCSQVGTLQAGDFQSFISTNVVDSIYYRKYSCDFITCLNSGEQIMPLAITELAHNFYGQILNYAIIVTIALGALFVALSEGVAGRIKSLGFSLLWSSGPFVIVSFFLDKIVVSFAPAQISNFVGPVLSTFFSPTFTIYLYIFAAAIALVAAGYLVGMKSKKFSKKK